MLLILTTGLPVTGKTTTANTLKDYFTENGYTCEIFGKTDGHTYNRENIQLNIYRWVMEKTSDVAIIDGVLLNYFDRREIFDIIDQATEKDPDTEVHVVAIQHNRTTRFCREHNTDPGHFAYNSKTVNDLSNITQQPLKREGISIIYHVKYLAYLNLPGFIKILNKTFNLDLPVPEEDDVETGDTETPIVSETSVASDDTVTIEEGQ